MTTIRVNDIPEEGLHLEYEAAKEAWVRTMLHTALHDHFLPDDSAQITLNLVRGGEHVTMIGGIYLRTHAVCDRCLKEFPFSQQVPLHMILAPATTMEDLESGMPWKEEGSADDIGDVQFGLYQSGEIDLSRILSEQVVLAQPMQSLCVADCKGLCDHCGKDLNEGPCNCPAEAPTGPFSKLAKLAVR